MSDRAAAARRNPSYMRVANIIGIRQLDSGNDVDQIEAYIRENGDPYENALAAANKATEDVRNKSIDDLNNLTIGFTDSIKGMNDGFNKRYGDLQAAANDRYNSLNNILIQRTADFNSQLGRAQDALDQSQALYDEQVRIAANQANAYVPDANPRAQTATAGDDRENLFSNTQPKKTTNNQANELSLLSGIGSQKNPLAGLQIA